MEKRIVPFRWPSVNREDEGRTFEMIDEHVGPRREGQAPARPFVGNYRVNEANH